MGFQLGMVVCARKTSTPEVEAGGLSKYQGTLNNVTR